MDKFEVGLVGVLTVALVCILAVGYAPFSPFSPFKDEWKETINIRTEIGKLRTYNGGNYSMVEYDWAEWSRQMRDADGNFTRLETFEEFKLSLENRTITALMFDDDSRVVWYNPFLTDLTVYLEY